MTSFEDDIGPTDQMIEEEPSQSPKMQDKYHMTHILFYVLGTLTLVPANFFTTANEYWMYKFRDTELEDYNSENRTGLQAEFTSVYSIVANVSNVVFLVLTIFIARKVCLVKRMVGALCGAISMFAVTVIFVKIDTDSWQTGFFTITLITGILLTASCAVFMVTLFELVSKFPAGFLAAILSGQSICGIFAALVQIFALSIGASPTTNGLVYFLVGMFFVFVALIYFLFILNKSEFFRHNLYNDETIIHRPKITKEIFVRILQKIKYYMISMIIVLGCSITMHPGITSLIVSVDKGNGNPWNDTYFVAVGTFLFYNVFDYIGREFAGKFKKPTNDIVILIASIVRVAFIPLLLFCNMQPRHHLDVVFNKDYAYIIFIIIFAFTNGYLVNLCVIQVPRVTDETEKTLATLLILVFMLFSLGACSFISAALVNAL